MIFALIGNQNSGKTTLFNKLTGANQHVGNFPGVTVEQKRGVIKNSNHIIVDLPGIYSISPYTSEEIVTRDFLLKSRPDAIINIIDATNIERNLYLTMQLAALGIPIVIALNMMDEIRACGGEIDVTAIEKELSVDIIPISAGLGQGIEKLAARAAAAAQNNKVLRPSGFYTGALHKAIYDVDKIIENNAKMIEIPSLFAAERLVEGDKPIEKALRLNKAQLVSISEITSRMEQELSSDRESAIAAARYEYIETLCAAAVKKPTQTRAQARSVCIDRLLTDKYFGLPIFILIMGAVFWITFGAVGPFFSRLLTSAIDTIIQGFAGALASAGVVESVRSLIIDGIFSGVGSVLSFLPTILILFFFLSILEDSGYMARVAFVMDKLLQKIGLSGRSFVPMLIGFGCSVPAVMAARGLPTQRDRKITIALIPFISCSAKLPIYAVFASAFFPHSCVFVITSLYVLGLALAVLNGLIINKLHFFGHRAPFIMELPAYRLPSFQNTARLMLDKARGFIKKAFTVILICSLLVWFFMRFDARFRLVHNPSQSMLASLATRLCFIAQPLGFGDWRAVTALITGLSAKETVISSLAVLMNAADTAQLGVMLNDLFSRAAAYSFLCFTLLYMPCAATFSAIARELNSYKAAVFIMIYQLAFAWLVSFFVYRVACVIL